MFRVFIVLILLIASFVGGVYYERQDQSQIGELNQRIHELTEQSESLRKRNQELKETLKLVKRQIQTDRIAYKTLLDIVENSDSQQNELKAQLEEQKKLLESIQDN